METLPVLSSLEKLGVEIDLRLLALWQALAEDEDCDQTMRLLRAAYVHGYRDALCEETAGELLALSGYKITGRRR